MFSGFNSKLAVLESKFSMYEDLSREMLQKLESAVDKISEGNARIATILTKHDERIEQTTKTDNLIIKMIEEVKEENKEDHEKVVKRLESVEEKISEIDKIKWMTVGCGVVLTILTAAISSLASGWWTPSEMQMQRQGHVHQQNVTEFNQAD